MPSQLSNIDKNVSSIVAKLNTPSVTIDYMCPPPRLNIPYTNVQANIYSFLNGFTRTPTGVKGAYSQCLSQLADNMIVAYVDNINLMNSKAQYVVNKDLPVNIPCVYNAITYKYITPDERLNLENIRNNKLQELFDKRNNQSITDSEYNYEYNIINTYYYNSVQPKEVVNKNNGTSYIPSYMLNGTNEGGGAESVYIGLGGFIFEDRPILDINGNPIGTRAKNYNGTDIYVPQINGQSIPKSSLCYMTPTSTISSKPSDLVCQKQYCNYLDYNDFIITGTSNGVSECIINGNAYIGKRDPAKPIPTSGGICANFNTPS